MPSSRREKRGGGCGLLTKGTTLIIILLDDDDDADPLPLSDPREELDPILTETGIVEQRTPQPHKAAAVARVVAQIYDECREGFRPPPAESDDLWAAGRPLPVDDPSNASPAERRAALRQCLQNTAYAARDALIRAQVDPKKAADAAEAVVATAGRLLADDAEWEALRAAGHLRGLVRKAIGAIDRLGELMAAVDADGPTIHLLGDCLCRIGGRMLRIDRAEEMVLEGFVQRPAMSIPDMKGVIGYDGRQCVKIIRRLMTKYEGILAPAIQPPGTRGAGGYRINVRRAGP